MLKQIPMAKVKEIQPECLCKQKTNQDNIQVANCTEKPSQSGVRSRKM